MLNQNILFNDFGRLRSGWRFGFFALFFIFFSALFQFIVAGISIVTDFRPNLFVGLSISSLLALTAAIFAGWFCGKYLEDLPFRALGASLTKNWLKDLILGLIVGALTVSFAVLIAVVFGGLSFAFNAEDQSAILITLGVSFVVFAIAAAFEEALFRGYMLQTFARAGLAWFAIALTSVFFGLVHLQNPNAGWISTVNTMIAGIWFGIAYLKTRTLWFVFALHFMWNWMLGAFFGIEVSGLTHITIAPLLREIDRGPAWLTGENYGIEGGIACTIALIVSILLIWFVPFLKADEEMLELTSKENPQKEISA